MSDSQDSVISKELTLKDLSTLVEALKEKYHLCGFELSYRFNGTNRNNAKEQPAQWRLRAQRGPYYIRKGPDPVDTSLPDLFDSDLLHLMVRLERTLRLEYETTKLELRLPKAQPTPRLEPSNPGASSGNYFPNVDGPRLEA